MKNSIPLRDISGSEPSYFVDETEIAPAQGTSCELDLSTPPVGIYIPSKSSFSRLVVRFYNCLPAEEPSSELKACYFSETSSESSAIPATTALTADETRMIQEILNDKVDIQLGEKIWKYNAQENRWTFTSSLEIIHLSLENLKNLLVSYDVLNAKKENNIWRINLKNDDSK